MAPKYTDEQYARQRENPAAPEGLQQAAGRFSDATLAKYQQYVPDTYAQDARSWFGGRNVEGTNNGWSTEFQDKMQRSQDAWMDKVAQSRKQKDPERWLSAWDWLDVKKNPDATGVATYDDPHGRFKRGDVVEDGQVRPERNVYKNFDRATADLMLAPYMFSAQEQQRFNRDSQVQARYQREVDARAQEWERQAKGAEGAQKYQAAVYDEKGELDTGAMQTGLVAGGVAGGAALGAGAGAALGSVVPFFGNVVGAVGGGLIGGALGGLGSFLNRDQLTEDVARGRVQADMARQRYGTPTAFAATATEWGGVGRRWVSPFGNLLQGGYDALSEGGVGDGTAAFQAVDPTTGERIASGWWQAADLGAALADGVVQFGSPVGRAGFMTSMGLTVAGGVTTMATTGAGFNERIGDYDPYEGAEEWVYALGNVGIDALQLGIAGQIGRAAKASGSAFGAQQGVLTGEGAMTKALAGEGAAAAATRRALGLRTPEEAVAGIATKNTKVLIDGRKYTLDDAGNAIHHRAAATMIVPSEALRWVATSWLARSRAVAGRASTKSLTGSPPASGANRWVSQEALDDVGGAVGRHMPGSDDLYRASLSLANESMFRNAMLNGFAEGGEEAVQAIFEPSSFSASINPEDVVRAGLYGWASGMGMGIGAHPVDNPTKQEARALTNHLIRTGRDQMDPEEWKRIYHGESVTDEMRRRMAIPDRRTVDRINLYQKVYKELHRHQEMGSVLPITALNAVRSSTYEKLQKARNPNIEGSRVLMGRAKRLVAPNGMVELREFADDAAVQSLDQTVLDLLAKAKGLEVQEKALTKDLQRWTEEAARTDLDPEQIKQAMARRDEYTARLADFPALRQMAQQMSDQLLQAQADFHAEPDERARQAIIDSLNTMLSDAYDQVLNLPPDEARRAMLTVELRLARHPIIDPGSSAYFRPQISHVLTVLGQDATAYIVQGRLKAMNADHDGDQGVAMNGQYLDEDQRTALRRGVQYMQTEVELVPLQDAHGNPLTQPKLDRSGNPVLDPATGKPVMEPKTLKRNRVTVVRDPADGHRWRVLVAADALADAANPHRQGIVDRALKDFERAMTQRYVTRFGIFGPDDLQRILTRFRTDVENGDADAEQTLLDEMFNTEQAALLELADVPKPGEPNMPEKDWIESELEDLWVAVQQRLAANAGGEQRGVSSGAPQVLPEETSHQQQVAMRDAETDGLTLQLLQQYVTDPTRMAQGPYYSPFYRSAVQAGIDVGNGRFDSPAVQEFIAQLAQLGSGQNRSALEEVTDKNPIEDRVVRWLSGVLQEARRTWPDEPAFRNPAGAIVLLANTAAPLVEATGVNQYRVTQSTTLLQVLLQRSIDIEKLRQQGAREDDAITKRIEQLQRLTHPQSAHSTTANRALMAVFGDVPMVRLAGRAADGVGGHLTPNQLARELFGLGPDAREDLGYKWRRLPAYLKPFEKRHDPPHAVEEYTHGNVSAFSMLIDAIIAEAPAVQHAMDGREATASKQFHVIHASLRTIRDNWRKDHYERLLGEARARGERAVTDQMVLRDLLESQPSIAAMLVAATPEASLTGIFHYGQGKVWTAPWYEQMLLLEDAAEAELMLFLHSGFAELNALGGRFQLDPDIEKARKKVMRKKGYDPRDLPPQDLVRGIRDPLAIKGRFARMIYTIASEDPTGYELDRLMALGLEAGSLARFLEQVNAEPNWIGDQAPLMGYHNDVALFEDDPADVWRSDDLMGQKQREALRKGAERLASLSDSYAQHIRHAQDDINLLSDLARFFEKPDGQADSTVKFYAGQLLKMIENAKMYPDSIGPAALEQFMAMVQRGNPQLEDKGAPDPDAEPMGQAVITLLNLAGFTSGLSSELAVQTSQDWMAVLGNLTGLAKEPARIMLADGSQVEIDFSDPKEAPKTLIRLLQDPRTRAFAKAVFAPTQRDVTAEGTISHRTSISTAATDQFNTPLKRILADASFGHLLPKERLGRFSYDQAAQIIGMGDSAVRAKAVGASEQEQAAAHFPVMRIINELLVARMHGPDARNRDTERERADLIQDVATVLMNLTLVNPRHLPRLKEAMEDTLKERFLSGESGWGRLNLSPEMVEVLDIQIRTAVDASLQARIDKVVKKIGRLQPNDPDEQVLTDELEALQKKVAANAAEQPLRERLKGLPHSVSGAINHWTRFVNDTTQPDLMGDARLSLLDYLKTGDRLDRLVEKDSYLLTNRVNDLRAVLRNHPDEVLKNDIISPEQWEELAYFAAAATIAESAANFSSGVGLTALKLKDPEFEQISRYYDRSWASILDRLFDPQLLAVTRQIADQSLYRRPGVTYLEVAEQADRLLFSEQKIGQWTPLAVTQNRRAAKALDAATVLGALQSHGIAPMEHRDVVGASFLSYAMPQDYDRQQGPADPAFAEHHSRLAAVIRHTPDLPGTLVGALDPFDYLKLEHHMVRRVEVLDRDGNSYDWTAAVTDPYMLNDAVTASGYHVFRGDLFQDMLDQLQSQHGPGDYQVLVDYVDVDKKPHTAEFVNSVLFDGVGPSGQAMIAPSVIADLIFGVGQISKQGQQSPMDVAAKGGSAFRQIELTDYRRVQQGEATSAPLSRILSAKAAHMWGKEYETGHLPLGANVGLYKLLKMRHVVKGQNADGKTVFLWAEDVIRRETMGESLPFVGPYRLIALSTPVLQTILGRSGEQGTPAALTMPELNIANIDRWPSLDLERLRQLGLERLGETAELSSSAFAQVRDLPPAVNVPGGKEALSHRRQARRARFLQWQGEVHEVLGNRALHRKTLRIKGSKGFLAANRDVLRDMAWAQKIAPLLSVPGVPLMDAVDLSDEHLSDRFEKSAEKILGKGGALWLHRHSETPDVTRGVLGRVSLDRLSRLTVGSDVVGPIHVDAVVIDLDDLALWEQNGQRLDHREAVEEGKRIVRAYAERGVKIVLGARGAHHLRSDLAQWMREGEVDYSPMKDSSHWFEPARIDSVLSRNVDALESTLDEVRMLSPRDVSYWMVSDFFGVYASENAVLFDYANAEQARFKRPVNVLIPTSLRGSSTRRKSLWNLPVDEPGQTSAQWERARERLGKVLRDPDHVAHLKRQSGGADGNPEGVPLAQWQADGTLTTLGVLSFDDALQRLLGHIDTGTMPTDPGQTLIAGDFYVVMSAKGDPMLLRYGFKIPKGDAIARQLQASVGHDEHVRGEDMVGVAVARAELQEEQTVPAPSRIQKVFSDRNGVRVLAEYDTSVMTKMMMQQLGFKAGFSPMPENIAFPEQPMSLVNGLRIFTGVTMKALASKQATHGRVRNLREAFFLTGIDFKDDVLDFLFGPQQRTDEQKEDQWADALLLLNAWSDIDWDWGHLTPHEGVGMLLDAGGVLHLAQQRLNTVGAAIVGEAWKDRNFLQAYEADEQDVTSRIGAVVLATLMLPRIRPEHVIGTRGMLNVADRQGDARITLMPPFMTEALNNPRFKATREEIFRRINANAAWPTEINPVNGEEVPVYYLDPDFTFWVRMRDPQTGEPMLVESQLQRTLALPFEKDSASIAAAQLSQVSNVSAHVASVSAESVGAWTALLPGRSTGDLVAPNDLEALFGENDVKYFDGPGSSFHDIFDRMRIVTDTYSPWERLLPLQKKYKRQALAKRVAYNEPIGKTDLIDGQEKPWSPEAERLAVEFLGRLNLDERSLYEVDVLVRQFVGRPGAQKPDDADRITEDVYRQAVKLMIANVDAHMHPLHGGAVPMESEMFWSKVFDAQRGLGPAAWAPVKKLTWGRTEVAVEWEQWVDVLLQQVRTSNAPFHGMFRTDLDGFLHTYIGSTPTYNDLMLSFDTQRDLLLMDQQMNKFHLSLDPLTNAALESPVLLDSMGMDLGQLTGHDLDLFGQDAARTAPLSTIAEQLERQKKWLKGQRLAKQKPTTVFKYYQEGLSYRESGQSTGNFFRALRHMQIINQLFNPSLFVSAFFEQPYRNLLEHLTNLAVGTQTSLGGKAVAGAAQTKAAQKLGLQTVYTPAEIKALRDLAAEMGEKSEFKAYISRESYYMPIPEGSAPNRLARALERGAHTVARMTGDPRIGMSYKSAAQRYNESALEYLRMVDSSITVEQYVKFMKDDPLWLHKRSPEGRVSAASVAVNRVSAVRGTRNSYVNRAALGWIDKLEEGGGLARQGVGFLLSVPFRYKRFNIGTFLTLTGLGGFDQMFAMMRDARPENSVVGRLQAAMRGKEYIPDGFTDFSDVIEDVSLFRPFIKGGMTHTLLLAGGLFVGHLGLDGEDEEAKRRRRMMQYLDGAYLYDPRKMENDFLYADALFLDSIPVLKDLFMDPDTGRSAVVPHWILRQFTSPLMGIQRFFNTGNPQEIAWGFQDAITVIPNTVLNTFNQAQEAARLLQVEADAYLTENPDEPAAQSAVTQLLINIGGIYERALIENSFVNGIRSGADEWDRDPYKEVKRDEQGNIVFENGQPVPTDELMAYRGEDDQVAQGYDKRSLGQARSHSYAENHATYSLLASLFTGQFNYLNSSYNRNNMAVKEQKVELPTASQAEAEALIMSAFAGKSLSHPQAVLTVDEITRILQQSYKDADVSYDMADLEAQAHAIHDAHADEMGGMSVLDAEGNEVITQAGATSVYRSLATGAVRWEDASLEGIVIPWEMRDKIAAEWLEELMQWGVDQGMSEQGAQYYAKRIWYGDQMNPDAPGLKELLYDDRIPGDGTVAYRQLNMMYALGPDGRPWATPFQRQSVLAAFGVPVPQRTPDLGPGMGKDDRGKAVDDVLGINTGLHGLVRKPTEPYEPPEDLFDRAAAKTYTPGRGGYARRGYGGGGYGGGGRGYFDRMQELPRGTAPDLPNIPVINTSNPYIRRADVRRQRISSERERLKQWQ